jgi:hypothetical protein
MPQDSAEGLNPLSAVKEWVGRLQMVYIACRSPEKETRLSGRQQQWLTDWRGGGDLSLDLETRWLAGQHHASSAPPAYRAAVEWWGAKFCAEWAP